jgi:predicted amidophosphoribosyltransferase
MLRQEQSLAQPSTVPEKTEAPQSAPDATCPQCNTRAQAGWRFCSQCGAPIETGLDS